jgi:hypothetical protein
MLTKTTGRKAYDGDENTSLVQWAWRQIQDSKTIVDVLDEEVIRKPYNLDEMCFVFKLGILCTCTNPSKRPSMKEVLKNLLRPNPAQPQIMALQVQMNRTVDRAKGPPVKYVADWATQLWSATTGSIKPIKLMGSIPTPTLLPWHNLGT